jgi:CheY-like chemotaxis protein
VAKVNALQVRYRKSVFSTGMVLDAMGHEVATAHDGIEGMKQAQGFRPDVILMDIG